MTSNLTITHAITRYSKAMIFFEVGQKARLFSNTAAMQGVPQYIIDRQLGLFEKVHPDYAAGVLAALEKMK